MTGARRTLARHESRAQQRLGLADPRVSAELAAHISVLGAAMSKPRPLNPLFDALTLSRPRSFAEWLDAGGLQSPADR